MRTCVHEHGDIVVTYGGRFRTCPLCDETNRRDGQHVSGTLPASRAEAEQQERALAGATRKPHVAGSVLP